MLKIPFTNAQSLDNFFDNVERLTTQRDCKSKKERASKMLATHILNDFLDKHRKLRRLAYLEKRTTITIDPKTALAVYVLADETEAYFTGLIGQTDQKIIV